MYKDQQKYKIRQFYRKKTHVNNYIKKERELCKQDVMERIYCNIIRRMEFFFTNNNLKKTYNCREIIGCDNIILKDHLQLLFKDGMNYNNYGEWEIDHIYPVSLINPNDENEIKKYFNYMNLQPLFKRDNIIKSNKIEPIMIIKQDP